MAPFPWTRKPRVPADIRDRISVELRCRELDRFQVLGKEFPPYRFVDLHRAAEHFSKEFSEAAAIESEHAEDLNSILHGQPQMRSSRSITQPGNIAWPSGLSEELSLPVDKFWLCRVRTESQPAPVILRVRYDPARDRVALEIASPEPGLAEACGDTIIERAAEASVYRNQLLQLALVPGLKDEQADIEGPDRIRILFRPPERVDEEDLLIGDDVRHALRRNVIDLHRKRELLKSHHVPIRRGVLLYGPPGTGKTFACRYLCWKLPDTTRIIVSGTALFQVRSIFSLARMLQPTLLILEDIDLVFASREVNSYSATLGELLDQMDALRPHEDVSFVLTTNAIERMEAAIRDRPGRVGQCIYFGPPKAEQRKRYLLHYLRLHSPHNLNIDVLVEQSDGATQAFLKEWVHRAVQIAVERLGANDDKLDLRDKDFREAMHEMRSFSEGSTGRIIGFHDDPS